MRHTAPRFAGVAALCTGLILALGGCGSAAEDRPMFRAADRMRPSAAAAADAVAGPSYDVATGELRWPALVVQAGASRSCLDVTLAAVSAAPIQLELRTSTGRACPDIAPADGLFDAGTGQLTLKALPVRDAQRISCWDVDLRLLPGQGPARVQLTSATPAACASSTAFGPGSFRGNVVLGTPTDRDVRANVYAPDQSGWIWLAWGPAPGTYTARTVPVAIAAGKPVELVMDGLTPNARHYYRLIYQPEGGLAGAVDEASFHTARATGSSFTFALQGDSHPERLKSQFDPALYTRTLQTAAADQPDFYILLGDDFSVDTLDPKTITADLVAERYRLQRPFLGLIGRSAPVFLVNGNHEQAARYLLDGTPNNVAVWAQTARNAHYSQPAPGAFYSGNAEVVPHIGLLRNHYAWHWGDALFVVIDPYWGSPVCVDEPFGGGTKRSDLWNVTHGDAQYRWLKTTLEWSQARYKFVFAHHVMGTGRGGIELATGYEWGGHNAKGADQFVQHRPDWPQPIHQLMVANKVTIFFQGHDHIWAHQQLDGVTYQTLPEPADPNYALYNDTAYLSGTKLPNSGYARVNVSPAGVKVDYVRTWLPADESPSRRSGSTAYSYTLPAR